MEATILLNSNENTRRIEDEEKTRFVRLILEAMGLPLEDLWDEDGNLPIDNKIKFRALLSKYGVQVIDDTDGEVKIYVDKDLVAIWEKPRYILRRDPSELDPTRKLFLEMHVKNWSLFEENNNE
jgi:hypothetical protein